MKKRKLKKQIIKKLAWGFLIFAFLLFTIPLLIPIPKFDDTVPASNFKDKDSKFVNIKGINIHYKEFGSGDRVYILLHGFGASTYTWHKIESGLAVKGRVIEFDRPAFGLTDRPLSWGQFNPYTPEAQVDLTIGLMDKLGIKKAVLIGHSAGAVVALNTAIEYPYRVSSLVIIDPAVKQTGIPAWAMVVLQIRQIDRFGPLIARSVGDNFQSLLRSLWYDPSKLTQEDYSAYQKPLKIDNWDKALWNLTKYTYSLEPEKHLHELLMPVVVINGDSDPLVDKNDSENIASKIKNAKFEIVEKSGHLPHEEQPAAVLDIFSRNDI